MKILMTSDTFLPLLGGAELHVYNLIKKLTSYNCKVTLVTNSTGNHDFDSDYIVKRVQWSKKNIFRIFKLLWEESKDVDVIHSHYCYRLALVAGVISMLRRKRFIITLHGMGILPHPGTNWFFSFVNYFYRVLSLKMSDFVISTSEDLSSFAFKYISPNKVKVVSNGVDIDNFNPNVDDIEGLGAVYGNKKIVMTVRRLVPKNGIHFLIETIPYIVPELSDVAFLIVGDGRMSDYIKKRVKDLKIDNYVTFFGAVENSLIPNYFSLADVIVFPSTAESSSLACAEAMAMGKGEIVASKVGGLIELLGEHEERGRLVELVSWSSSNYDAPLQLEEDKYKKLAKVIIECLKNKEENKINNALRYAKEELSWSVIAKKTIEIYK